MSKRSQLRARARRATRKLPPAWRSRAKSAALHTHVGARALVGARPVVSVIVPVYNVAAYLDECLTSLRRQSLTSMEIILVDDGSTDDSPQICARHAAADRRIRVHRQPNAGLGAARNAGIRLATGRYLTFLDSDDTLPRTAYDQMARTLNKTGSDFAIGAVRRVTRGKFSAPAWATLVHAFDRLAITVDDFPEAVRDVIACNRMFRRSFWNKCGLSFPEGVAYEDHAPMMTAFVRAKSFDLLKAVTYYWRIREDHTSIGQQKHELTNLRDRLAAKDAAYAELVENGSEAVRTAWLHRVLDMDLNLFVDQVPEASDEYWDLLSHGVLRYLSMASPELLAGLRVDRRLKLWLVAHGRREQVGELLDAQRFEGAQLQTEAVDGHLYARLPFYDDADLAIPREIFEVGPEQAELVTSLRAGRWVSGHEYAVDIWAYVRYLDMADHEPRLTARLVRTSAATAGRSEPEQAQAPSPAADDGLLAAQPLPTTADEVSDAADGADGADDADLEADPEASTGAGAEAQAAAEAGDIEHDTLGSPENPENPDNPAESDGLADLVNAEVMFTGPAGNDEGATPIDEQPGIDEPVPVSIELPVQAGSDPAATRWARLLYQDYRRAAATITIDANALITAQQVDPATPGTQSKWRLELELSVAGITRSGTIAHRDATGSSAVLSASVVGQHRVVPQFDDEHGLVVTIHRPALVLSRAEVDGRVVSGLLQPDGSPDAADDSADPDAGELDRLELDYNRVLGFGPYKQRCSAPLRRSDEGLAFDLTLPRLAPNNHAPNVHNWSLELAGPHGRRSRIPWPTTACLDPQRPEWLAGSSEIRLHRSAGSNVEIREVGVYPTVERFSLVAGDATSNDRLIVDGTWAGLAPTQYQVRLASHRVSLTPSTADYRTDGYHAEFDLCADEWGFGTGPLPSAKYVLDVSWTDGARTRTVRPRVSDALTGDLPLDLCTGDARYRGIRNGLGYLTIEVGPPLTDDELGNYAQTRLRAQYRDDPVEVERGAVLFQCYRGETATDSQLALCNELARRDPRRPLYWGIADRSVAVPVGSIPLVIGSAEYYQKLARVEFLCNNIDFDRYFSKRPHQRFLQTFHGYPFKSMGLSFWHSKDFTKAQIDHEIARRLAAWDVILTPTPQMNRYYRDEYRYTGPIIDTGYPRNDILVADSDHAELIRKQTRALLDIDDGQTVVMYAPTWRDDQATGAWSAKLVSYLDLQRASEALGGNYVLLLRGHNYVSRMPARTPRTARVIDVTDYPEINDLILASDAAVLDYSSLRFDYALTGRPMIFLVPDLEAYGSGGRGFLFDYEDTAPGPMLTTSDEVIAALADLDAVRNGYSARYDAFNEKYNYNHDGGATARVVDAFFERED